MIKRTAPAVPRQAIPTEKAERIRKGGGNRSRMKGSQAVAGIAMQGDEGLIKALSGLRFLSCHFLIMSHGANVF